MRLSSLEGQVTSHPIHADELMIGKLPTLMDFNASFTNELATVTTVAGCLHFSRCLLKHFHFLSAAHISNKWWTGNASWRSQIPFWYKVGGSTTVWASQGTLFPSMIRHSLQRTLMRLGSVQESKQIEQVG